MRFFFGAMFVYAGLDKLLDPSFFDPEAASSIQNQLAIFERFSILGPLVHLALPLAIPLGLLIALGEIGVGLGALTGLAYRLSALGGAIFAGLFFLTASWTVRPYYLGPDLPYLFGWITLALAGHGGLLVVSIARRHPNDAAAKTGAQVLVSRRNVLQVGGLAALTLLLGGAAGALRLLFTAAPATPVPQPTPAPTGSGPLPTVSPTAPPNGIAVARIADVDQAGSARFRIPATAPAPLPAGDPGVVIRLDDGSYVAYDATCTHEGCRVGWQPSVGLVVCPCHGAEFDAADHGAVIAGPTEIPLVELPLIIDAAGGMIYLRT
jgi:thiosulfate dehydrogenase [quinone] large subunit